jgi:uncharacterized membrane protein YiaA
MEVFVIESGAFLSAAERFGAAVASLDPILGLALAVPVLVTMASLSPGLIAACALAAAGAAYALGLANPEAVLLATGLWLAELALVLTAVGAVLRRRRERDRSREVKRLEAQVNALAARQDLLFMQQLRASGFRDDGIATPLTLVEPRSASGGP